MTGRCPDVDAARTVSRGPRTGARTARRAACLAVGLLCALGLVSGAVLRSHGDGHRHHAHAIAACATVTDGHGAHLRADPASLTTAQAAVTDPCFAGAPAATATDAPVGTPIDSVRTRGPPVGL